MRWVEEHWGTQIVLEVPQPVPDAAFDDLRRWFARVDELFSTWRADSEVRRLAAGSLAVGGHQHRSSRRAGHVRGTEGRDARSVRHRGRCASRCGSGAGTRAHRPVRLRQGMGPRTRGRDAARPRSRELLDQRRAETSWSGDDEAVDHPWQVGVQHPWITDRAAAVIEVSDGGVATSGRYERGDHVLDPRTGRPATTWMSMTVAGPDLGFGRRLRHRGDGTRRRRDGLAHDAPRHRRDGHHRGGRGRRDTPLPDRTVGRQPDVPLERNPPQRSVPASIVAAGPTCTTTASRCGMRLVSRRSTS